MRQRPAHHRPATATEPRPGARPSAARRSPTDTFGGDPIARVEERIRTRRQQTAVVAAMLVLAGAALATGHRAAVAVVVGCVVAEITLAASLLMLASDRHTRVLEVIAAGGGAMTLPAVDRERRRLRARSHRCELARSLRALADEAPIRLVCPPAGRSLFTPRVLAAVATELRAVARRLEEDPIGVAGVASTELLLTAHDSPLYGADTTRLRHELGRVNFALQSLEWLGRS